MPDVSTVTLNNGVALPALGLGVFQTPPDETRDAVTAALAAGYRHIDTAAAYGNERQVGEAIAASDVARDDVFIETKIWISDYGYDQTLHGFEKSARKLGVQQIDLLILHQALPTEFDKTLDAYRALETLLADGKVRAIGVSNFMVDHLTQLLDVASVVPAVNQIELHPYFQQPEVQAKNAEQQHPDPGVVADRWDHLLPRRRAHQHPAGPGHRRHRRSARQDCGPGDAALGHPARPLGHPEVDQAGPDRGEPRRLRLRPHRRPARRDRRARYRPPRWPRARSHHAGELRPAHPRGLTGPDFGRSDRDHRDTAVVAADRADRWRPDGCRRMARLCLHRPNNRLVTDPTAVSQQLGGQIDARSIHGRPGAAGVLLPRR